MDALPSSRPGNTKTLCLYLNSTSGLVTLLGIRDNRKPSYPSFSMDTLRSLPVPNFPALDSSKLDMLDGWFDWLRHEALQSLPQMHEDPVRRHIDQTVTEALRLDLDWVAALRHGLAREPSITGAVARTF